MASAKHPCPPQFDEDGFLTDPSCWNEEMARQIARDDGLGELGDGHWAVIRELREHYLNFGAIPALNHVCRVNHLEARCMTSLFPSAREAWRVAGLPNPGEEAKTYM